MTRPRDPLGPPLARDELVRDDETRVVEQLDVVVKCLRILAAVVQSRVAAFEIEQYATEKIDVALHGA